MNKIMPHHLQQLANPSVKVTRQPEKVKGDISFQSLLRNEIDKTGEIKLSRHAEKRIQARGIEITEKAWQEINGKVDEAGAKGVNDALVITNSAALIVNAKNKTVITAMDREEMNTQLFTNINGAIVIEDE
ncbi:TIGR02530 family flagellar biosynthesis protein [Evansella clarkii]|uniref:TIGR02530 family flagellar biosynthesis protein n=1 Tax=Evansella clarkii TaxID=79879 RepID=UPI000B43E380|nr:TIGR02530 family flagellar biosynthesis protein [Evansella clarkii]